MVVAASSQVRKAPNDLEQAKHRPARVTVEQYMTYPRDTVRTSSGQPEEVTSKRQDQNRQDIDQQG